MMKSLREFTQEVINQCHRACLIVLNQCCLWFPSVLLVGGFSFSWNRSWFDSLRFVPWWLSTVSMATPFQSVNLSISSKYSLKDQESTKTCNILDFAFTFVKNDPNGANVVYLVAFYYIYIYIYFNVLIWRLKVSSGCFYLKIIWQPSRHL